MKELAIGEELRIRCVEDKDAQEGCDNCALADMSEECVVMCHRYERTDGKNVHFELMEEAHPKNTWHKAWEELPQEFKYVENTMQGRREWTESEQVLVINNHYQKSVDSTKNGEWVRLRNLPTDCDGFKTFYLYWMEIPELPKEEEI